MKRKTAAALLIIALLCTACSKSETASQDTQASSNAETASEDIGASLESDTVSQDAQISSRAEDLDYLCDTLEKNHKNLYAHISKEDFQKEKQNIMDHISDMSDSEFYYSLKHLISLVGDAHTNIAYTDSNYSHLNGLGFAVVKYSDGWHLMMLEEKNKDYLGYKLVAINNVKIGDIFEKAKTIISYENEAWVESMFSNTINFREALEYLKIIDEGGIITLQIQKDDNSEVETLEIESMNEAEIFSANIIQLTPESMPQTYCQGTYRAMELNEDTYFIQYNSCREAADLPMSEFVDIVSDDIRAGVYSKIIIDMRYNTGGNSAIFEPMIEALKDLQTDSGFEVYTLIGSNTFSSAIINSVEIKNTLGGMLVGTQTGGNVNGYGELKEFTLPNSPIMVLYSTKYFELIKDYDKDSLYPDIPVEQSFTDYMQGIDGEVETVINLD